MLSKGGEMTGASLALASATAPLLLLLRGGVPLSMSSGCARKKPVKSPDGATWRPNTESVDIMLHTLLGSDTSRPNTAAGVARLLLLGTAAAARARRREPLHELCRRRRGRHLAAG